MRQKNSEPKGSRKPVPVKKRRLLGVLMIVIALVIMQFPSAEADAASSVSDFNIEGGTLTKYQGAEKNVTIPDTVEVIGRGAFEDNASITLVMVPDSVKRIDPYAFWGCSNLDTVVLGGGLTQVGDHAFMGCKGLKQMTIPSTVTSIGIRAFADCVNLIGISIPAETKEIHETAFHGCNNVTIYCDAGTAASEFAESFYARRGNSPAGNPATAATADGSGAVGSAVSADGSEVPGNAVSVDGSGVAGSPVPADRSGAAGSAVSTDGSGVAENPVLPEGVVAAGSPSPADGSGAAGNPVSADGTPAETAPPTPAPTAPPVQGTTLGTTQIVGNRAVVLMDSRQFKVYEGTPAPDISSPPIAQLTDEGSLPKYRIVDGRIVADQAYYRSMDLGEMTLPEGIREVGEFSFARSSVSGIVLPQGVEKISYGAFYHCDALERVVLPDTVLCVEPRAFSSTPWVENFRSGRTGEGDFLVEGGVLAAYRGAAESVAVPEGVRVIAAEVFRDHMEIKSVALPDSLVVIGEGAFQGCSALRQITFGTNVQEIKDRAFSGVSSQLDHVTLPASVRKLGLQAFGRIQIVYEGEEPERTYENSAARLAGSAYRVYEGADGRLPGVAVIFRDGTAGSGGAAGSEGTAGTAGEPGSDGASGSAGASASLEGADRGYTLTIDPAQDVSGMENACRRVFGVALPLERVIYDMTLTDSSNIPLKDLGSQALTVVLPVPEALRGQKLRVLSLDRNGQLETLEAERVAVDGVESVSFRTDYVSQTVIYGIGGTDAEPMELSVAMEQFGAGPGGTAFWAGGVMHGKEAGLDSAGVPSRRRGPGFWAAGVLLAAGAVLLLTGVGGKRGQ